MHVAVEYLDNDIPLALLPEIIDAAVPLYDQNVHTGHGHDLSAQNSTAGFE